jgi:hypothetical protein
MCAVDLAGVKAAISQFHLHIAHVVVRRNCFDECKADRDRDRWAEVDMSGSTLSQSEGSDRVSMEQIRSATAASPSAKQPEHSPHDKNQYRNRENAHRHKVANGIAKNVIRISRIEAVEPVKRGRQRG